MTPPSKKEEVTEAPKTPEAKILPLNYTTPPPPPVKAPRRGMTMRPPPPPSPSPNTRINMGSPMRASLLDAELAAAANESEESDAEVALSTPIVQAAQLQSPFTPSSAEPAERFPVGQEVFLLDAKGNSIVSSKDIKPATLELSQVCESNTESAGRARNLISFDAPNVFVVAGRYPQAASESDPSAAEAQKIGYKLCPKDGLGRDRMTPHRDLLLEVRFRPGDRVYYLEKDEQSNTTIRWAAVVRGAEAIRGERIYEIHMVHQGRNKILVTDDLLEAFTGVAA